MIKVKKSITTIEEEKKASKKAVKVVKVEATLTDVSSTGRVTISFNQDMDIEANLTKIDNTVLVLKVISNANTEVKYKWETSAVSARTLTLQIYFEEPLLVSA